MDGEGNKVYRTVQLERLRIRSYPRRSGCRDHRAPSLRPDEEKEEKGLNKFRATARPASFPPLCHRPCACAAPVIDGIGRGGVALEDDPLAGAQVGAGVEDTLGIEAEPAPILAVDLGEARVDSASLGPVPSRSWATGTPPLLTPSPGTAATAPSVSSWKMDTTPRVGLRSSTQAARPGRIRSKASSRMPGVSMTCWAMSGSGVRMDCGVMARITRSILSALRTPARTVSSGAGPGASARAAAVARTASGTSPTTAAAALASAVPECRCEPSGLGTRSTLRHASG